MPSCLIKPFWYPSYNNMNLNGLDATKLQMKLGTILSWG